MKIILRYFNKAVKLFPQLFLMSILLILALTVMDALMPWALRVYLDQLTEKNSIYAVLIGILLFAAYLLLKLFVKIKWYISLDNFGGQYIESLSLELERTLAETDYSEIERIGSNVIRNILFSDVLNIFRVIGHHIPSALGSLAIIIACISVSLAYSGTTTIFILFSAMVGFLISWGSRKIVAKYAGKTNAKLKRHDSWCDQFVSLLPLIHNHNVLHYFQANTSKNLQEFLETAIEEDRKTMLWSGLANSYHQLFSIALSALLAIPLSGNSIPDLVFFTMLADIVMEQTQKIEMLFQQIMKHHVSFVHVSELHGLRSKYGNLSAATIESLIFAAVDFEYANGVAALKNVSCCIKKGEIVRLSGDNGSGKSTFLKLLTGLYSSTNGEILINGINIGRYSKDTLNKQFLYVDQDEQCLNENFKTYLELITARKITTEKYVKYLSELNINDDGRFIQDNGKSLSAGQRKKLMLLKYLIGSESASVIVLDELTAGMDTETTKQAYMYIKRAAKENGKIFFIVDHNAPDDFEFTHRFCFKNGEIRKEAGV